MRVRAQRLLYCGLKPRELAISLFTFGLKGFVAWRLESHLDRISGQSRSPAYLSIRELVAQFHAPHLANHVHGDHLLHLC